MNEMCSGGSDRRSEEVEVEVAVVCVWLVVVEVVTVVTVVVVVVTVVVVRISSQFTPSHSGVHEHVATP